MHSRIEILVDILYTPSQTILVIICGSFQYMHNLKKQKKIKEKRAFVTSDRFPLELHKQNDPHVKIHVLISLLDLHKSFHFYQFQLKLVTNCGFIYFFIIFICSWYNVVK